ncbi:hypothetical protein MUP59_00640 [Candidatus Bathyarchaeota archaeon]|nr:hypothetical protein [Candidatus Bathyarchaeota archaeon]
MTTKYGIKEYLEEYKGALEQKPEVNQPQNQNAKPNALKELLAKAKLGKKQ